MNSSPTLADTVCAAARRHLPARVVDPLAPPCASRPAAACAMVRA
ncbi:hypothetical protein AB2N08_04295 [Massilia aurea]